MISGHRLAQRRWGAKQRGEGGPASTPLTFALTQLCQPRSSAHPSPCWLLPGPQDLQRWLHMLDYLSSQVLGTRGLAALSVISQSRAQTHLQRGGQGIIPGNKRTSKPHGLPVSQGKAKHQYSPRIEILARSTWGRTLEAEAFTHYLSSLLSQE